MPWAERQLAMLNQMGVRLWLPPQAPAGEPVPALAAPVAVAVDRAAAAVATGPAIVRGIDVAASELAVIPARHAEAAKSSTPATLPTGVAVMDWPALREAVSACTACPLCEARRQTVFGVGSEHAHWMVVGEAPGEQEDLRGEPFVGKSGQLLDNMLSAIGLTRGDATPARQAYIANSVKCRPPGNRNPAPAELAQCEPFLIRQVQLLKPRIILAMGRFAVQSLLRSAEPIGRLRGRVHCYQGVPLIVTYHPAYLLRNLEDKAKAWDDLCLAVETVRANAAP
jgi:DNA polymerase